MTISTLSNTYNQTGLLAYLEPLIDENIEVKNVVYDEILRGVGSELGIDLDAYFLKALLITLTPNKYTSPLINNDSLSDYAIMIGLKNTENLEVSTCLVQENTAGFLKITENMVDIWPTYNDEMIVWPYVIYNEADFPIIDTKVMTQPLLINANKPHKYTNKSDKYVSYLIIELNKNFTI